MIHPLTIVASNKNRLSKTNPASNFFIKSLKWQTRKDFSLIIVDGGSENRDEVDSILAESGLDAKSVSHPIGDAFLRSLLNNVGVRAAKTPYILTTDVDMLYAKEFVQTVMSKVDENTLLESRTMYWKQALVNKIYSGELNPEENIDACKIGRIKKRTTAGGAQCMHINSWNKLRGFDEAYIGWGSEDCDLLERAKMAKLTIKWIGENKESIMLFHQPHHKDKKSREKELKEQEENKKLLHNIKTYIVNKNGWGGIYG